MLRMMTYGRNDDPQSANYILKLDNLPYTRCISYGKAIDFGASNEKIIEWKNKYIPSQNLPKTRLIPAQAVESKDDYLPFAFLYDDSKLNIKQDRWSKSDSWKAGYTYQLVSATIDGVSHSVTHTTGDGGSDVYSIDGDNWFTVVLHNEYTTVSSHLERLNDSDKYTSVISIFEVNTSGENSSGSNKSIIFSFLATKINSGVPGTDANGVTVQCVAEDKTDLNFDIPVTHLGSNNIERWASIDANPANTLSFTISHYGTAGTSIDIALISEGSDMNGSYFDSTGYVGLETNIDYNKFFTISKDLNVINLQVNWKDITDIYAKDGSYYDGAGPHLEFYVYAYFKGTEINSKGKPDIYIGDGCVNVNAFGNLKKIQVNSAGDLNKSQGYNDIINFCTCMYKIDFDYGTPDENGNYTISIRDLIGSEQGSYSNVGGVHGVLCQSNCTDIRDVRTYVNSTPDSEISIYSEVNGDKSPFTISKYKGVADNCAEGNYEIYKNGVLIGTINDDNYITINPDDVTTTGIKVVSNYESKYKWITVSQRPYSTEYINISFTPNS